MTRGKEQLTGRRALFFNAKPAKIAEKALSLQPSGRRWFGCSRGRGPRTGLTEAGYICQSFFFAAFASSALKMTIRFHHEIHETHQKRLVAAAFDGAASADRVVAFGSFFVAAAALTFADERRLVAR